ncbi:transcriptional enhancer factor TEF-1-like [Watersipora subatra]|uniref:transcriptional enhancer factor TEF-1-like n=1 Tax=Watersipora subatra TaxID=2589382 RepID=UPI00355C55D8
MSASAPWGNGSGVPAGSESIPSVSGMSNGSKEDDDMEDDGSNDAEGVWSPEIEQSFQEALAIYPPCGRRKIILSDEGKMYGRNELIARYIKLRTGKTRSRKQVSSHIQVLARRKTKDIQGQLKTVPGFQSTKEKALATLNTMSSAQIVSASALQRPGAGMSHMHPNLPTHHPGMRAPYPQPPHAGGWSPVHGVVPISQSHELKPGYTNGGYGGNTMMDIKPSINPHMVAVSSAGPISPSSGGEAWEGRSIAGPKLRLCDFSAFLEQQRDAETVNKHIFVQLGGTVPTFADPQLEVVDIRQIYDKFPDKKGGLKDLYEKGPANAFFLVKFWADLNTNVPEESGAFYGVTSQYESAKQMTISCSTKVCSFGKQVVEKVETEYARFENGRFVYRIHRSAMCDYMVTFIHKLKQLPEKYMMNSVLENFTILQVVTNKDTQETLLCIAFVFEVSTSEHGAQHHIYRLVKD